MTIDDGALLAHLVAHPEERDAYAVYGDALTTRGDPRGELIALQLRLADQPDDARARARESELLRKHRRAWLGALADLPPRDLGVTWRHGFVHAVRLGAALDAYAESDLEIGEAIAALTRLPHVALVRELVIGTLDRDRYTRSWAPAIAALAEHGAPPHLAVLALRRSRYHALDTTELGDLTPIYPVVPQLRELVIEAGTLELGAPELPALERLTIITNGLTAADVHSICMAAPRSPHLAHLSLCLGETGNEGSRCDVTVADLAPILAGDHVPGVRHLGLANSNLADAIAAAIARSAILPQLETLDLSRGTLTDVGARAILDRAATFAHLRALDLSHAYLSSAVRAELATLGPSVALDDPQSPDDDFREIAIR